MTVSVSICFNRPGSISLPVDITNPKEYLPFRADNPHMMNGFVPSGMPFIMRDDYSLPDANWSWRKAYPDLARQFTGLLNLNSQERVKIAKMLHQFGPDNLIAISRLLDEEIFSRGGDLLSTKADPRIPANLNTYAGALVGVAQIRAESFIGLSKKYQAALENVRRAYKAKLPRHEILKLEQNAASFHHELNYKFKNLLSRYAPKAGSKGNVWTNVQRGVNQAKSARSYKPIQLNSSQTYKQVGRLASKAKWTGYGALVVDAGFRAEDVYGQYKAGDNWQKSAAVESTAFAVEVMGGAAAGSVATTVVATALGVALAATPVGWVIIVGAGLAAGYAGAVMGDSAGRYAANKVYETSSALARSY
jgi:hypothetical protein